MNLIEFYKLWYCRARMLAYLRGEHPIGVRRRMARYIDESPACYAEYMRQRDTMRELTHKLPLVGQPDKAQLDRVWAAVQSELQGRGGTRERYCVQARYGFAGMVLALGLLMPFTLGSRDSIYSVPSQPAPHTVDATSVAVVSRIPLMATPAVLPKATPEVAQRTSAHR
jgi:anti-sigma factor RsiW